MTRKGHGSSVVLLSLPGPACYGMLARLAVEYRPGITWNPGPACCGICIACAANTIKIGGTITGLSASGLVLLNNGGGATSIAANATQFVMGSPIAYGGRYSI